MNYFILFLGLFLILFPFWANYKMGIKFKNLIFLHLLLFIVFIIIMIGVTIIGLYMVVKGSNLPIDKTTFIVIGSMLAGIHVLLSWD